MNREKTKVISFLDLFRLNILNNILTKISYLDNIYILDLCRAQSPYVVALLK